MRLTFKYRLFPTKSQRTIMNETLEACRWVYNKTLEVRKNAWEQEQKSISRYEAINMLPEWKKENPFLKIAHSQVLQEVCTRIDLAFASFFRRARNGEKPGYPRFKGKMWYKSFTYPQFGFELIDDRVLRLSKIGDVNINLHRPVCGKVKTLIIKRDNLGNWFACFSCEVEIEPLPPSPRSIGIDLGLTTFATFSDGNEIKRQRWMKQDSKDIARLQRKKEQFPKGSQERLKVVRALQHAYKRVFNRRNNFAHQESRKLVNKYQFIAFEDLNIQDMQSNGNKVINQGIADVAWNQFVQFTTYKAEKAGRSVVFVDPKNTTQLCSGCGKIVPKDLHVRKHDCPHCGLILSRDHNAALNILARGMASLGSIILRSPTACCGEHSLCTCRACHPPPEKDGLKDVI